MTKMIGYVALAATALFATSALADGMPTARGVHIAAAAPAAQCSAAAWSGAYAGAQIGTAAFSSQVSSDSDYLPGSSIRHDDNNGLMIGGQIGYNMVRCSSLFGIEADLAWTNAESTWGLNPLTSNSGAGFAGRSELNWYSSIRTRAGITVDNLLLYMTGGIAFADIKHSGTATPGNWCECGGPSSFSNSDTRWGWVVGGGLEHRLSDRISVKAEALYTRFEDKGFTFDQSPTFGPGSIASLKAHDDLVTIRMGVNFKIGDRAEAYEPLK